MVLAAGCIYVLYHLIIIASPTLMVLAAGCIYVLYHLIVIASPTFNSLGCH